MVNKKHSKFTTPACRRAFGSILTVVGYLLAPFWFPFSSMLVTLAPFWRPKTDPAPKDPQKHKFDLFVSILLDFELFLIVFQ